jgi:hypothetical protein
MEIDQTTLDLLAKTAGEDATKSFPFLKYTRERGTPEWKTGDTFTTDAEAVFRTDEAARSFMRFAKGTKPPVEETPWLLALGNERPKRPASFTDQSKWDLWPDGRRKDPWVYRTRVPLQIMTGPAKGRVVLFNGDNAISRDLISELQVYFAKTGKRPLVLLTHEKIDGEVIPSFKVVRLTDDTTATPGLNHRKSNPVVNENPDEKTDDPKTVPVNGGGAATRRFGDDLNDEIPF